MNYEIHLLSDSITIHNSLDQIKTATASLASRFVNAASSLQIIPPKSHGLKSWDGLQMLCELP